MSENPTKEQKYDFVNEHLMQLKPGQKQTVIMEGRVYDVKYRGLEVHIYPEFSKEA